MRVDGSAVGGVLLRNYVVFLRTWRSNTVISVVDPVISLLAFGFGFGALVAKVGNIDYVEYVGTGIVAQTVLFTTIFPGMFETFFKRDYQHTYDGLLAAPVDAIDVVTAEALWLAAKASVFGLAPLAVAMAFGLDPAAGMLLIPLIGLVTGFGFACVGIFIAALASSFAAFDYVISMLVTPLFLFAGTFFPLQGLPDWVRLVAHLNPLFHTVELIRHAAFGLHPPTDLGHALFLAVFGVLAWAIASRRMQKRLVA
ncbi:MAG: lipooligosaccharide transport system permease protein [Frankiales bacterium]|nr:lipooligosaccharide transport system permease protein [Frankiales bacterium]